MCEPTILAIATTAYSLYAQDQAASAQTKANFVQADAARAQRNQVLDQVNAADKQSTQAAAQQIQQIREREAQAKSTARVSAATSGVSGLSVDALLSDLSGQAGRQVDAVQTNLENTQRGSAQSRINAGTQAQNTINSLRVPQGADFIGGALRIGSSVVGSR